MVFIMCPKEKSTTSSILVNTINAPLIKKFEFEDIRSMGISDIIFIIDRYNPDYIFLFEQMPHTKEIVLEKFGNSYDDGKIETNFDLKLLKSSFEKAKIPNKISPYPTGHLSDLYYFMALKHINTYKLKCKVVLIKTPTSKNFTDFSAFLDWLVAFSNTETF
ncbi:MAG: hypothetical protein RR436_00340 [Clostridia bacterium]